MIARFLRCKREGRVSAPLRLRLFRYAVAVKDIPYDLVRGRPWIGNTYLDDSGRDSPTSLNSTGDMQPSVGWILKLPHRCA